VFAATIFATVSGDGARPFRVAAILAFWASGIFLPVRVAIDFAFDSGDMIPAVPFFARSDSLALFSSDILRPVAAAEIFAQVSGDLFLPFEAIDIFAFVSAERLIPLFKPTNLARCSGVNALPLNDAAIFAVRSGECFTPDNAADIRFL
jgi:hypothetical protein